MALCKSICIYVNVYVYFIFTELSILLFSPFSKSAVFETRIELYVNCASWLLHLFFQNENKFWLFFEIDIKLMTELFQLFNNLVCTILCNIYLKIRMKKKVLLGNRFGKDRYRNRGILVTVWKQAYMFWNLAWPTNVWNMFFLRFGFFLYMNSILTFFTMTVSSSFLLFLVHSCIGIKHVHYFPEYRDLRRWQTQTCFHLVQKN